ncbi:MAG: sulfate ABC transporter substrate-binding protein [Deltaproteobacteria bacterium]|nr:sulfate ABC transporter substrate-binding protein [Deltaproteobacteria bacterium]
MLEDGKVERRLSHQMHDGTRAIAFTPGREPAPAQACGDRAPAEVPLDQVLRCLRPAGGAHWSYLAAWSHARRQGGEQSARAFIGELFAHVPVLDSGARGSTMTFAERDMGDVLIAWESEARLLSEKVGGGRFEIVVPPDSILTAPQVALVESNVDKHGTRAVAQAYLEHLFTREAQAIAERHFYRPTTRPAAIGLPPWELDTVEGAFEGWNAAQQAHFAEGALFDQLSIAAGR